MLHKGCVYTNSPILISLPPISLLINHIKIYSHQILFRADLIGQKTNQ